MLDGANSPYRSGRPCFDFARTALDAACSGGKRLSKLEVMFP